MSFPHNGNNRQEPKAGWRKALRQIIWTAVVVVLVILALYPAKSKGTTGVVSEPKCQKAAWWPGHFREVCDVVHPVSIRVSGSAIGPYRVFVKNTCRPRGHRAPIMERHDRVIGRGKHGRYGYVVPITQRYLRKAISCHLVVTFNGWHPWLEHSLGGLITINYRPVQGLNDYLAATK